LEEVKIMATQEEYTVVANALVALITNKIQLLPSWEQGFVPVDKIPMAAGAAAKVAVDTLDTYRAKEPKQ
jgi:hypothetical protein